MTSLSASLQNLMRRQEPLPKKARLKKKAPQELSEQAFLTQSIHVNTVIAVNHELGGLMKLYLVHCGFYDQSVCDGLYEGHANYFVVAASVEEARSKAKQLSDYQARRMHIDGVQEIQAVDGFRVELKPDSALQGRTIVKNVKYRELAPTRPASDVRI